jgi:hypothetical protein
MNYSQFQSSVLKLIPILGKSVTITYTDASTEVTTGVFTSLDEQTLDASSSNTTGVLSVCYVPGNLSKQIEVGNKVTDGSIVYDVQKVIMYKPAATLIAYKLIIEG